jgi:O-antigen/teichoic acid export membrane protein
VVAQRTADGLIMAMVSTEPPVDLAPRALSMRSNMSWTFLANVVYGAGQWALLILIAKFGSAAMLGIYALGIAVVTPVTMLSSLNLRPVLVTDVRNQFSFREYMGVRCLTTLLAGLVVVGILAFSRPGWFAAATTLIIFLGLAAEAISDICYGALQKQEQMDIIAISMCYRSVLSVISLGTLLFLTKNILWGIVGLTAARIFVTLTYDLPRQTGHRDESKPMPHMLTLSSSSLRIIWTALPLGIVLSLYSLNSNIPRYFISAHSGVRELGIFSAIASIVTIGGTVVNSLGGAAMPQLATKFSSGELRGFTHLLGKLVAMIALLGVLGIVSSLLVGHEFLRYAFRPEYAQHSHLLIAMMVAGAISYMTQILGYCHTAAQYFRPQVPLLAAGTVAVLIASHFLIPSHGLMGAVLSLGISWIVLLLGELVILAAVLIDLRGRSRVLRSAECAL